MQAKIRDRVSNLENLADRNLELEPAGRFRFKQKHDDHGSFRSSSTTIYCWSQDYRPSTVRNQLLYQLEHCQTLNPALSYSRSAGVVYISFNRQYRAYYLFACFSRKSTLPENPLLKCNSKRMTTNNLADAQTPLVNHLSPMHRTCNNVMICSLSLPLLASLRKAPARLPVCFTNNQQIKKIRPASFFPLLFCLIFFSALGSF